MSDRRELYRSPNGDTWFLGREPTSGHAFVIHQPNAPSGGRLSHIDVGDFLRDANGPEQQALLRLIVALVEVPPYADREASPVASGDRGKASEKKGGRSRPSCSREARTALRGFAGQLTASVDRGGAGPRERVVDGHGADLLDVLADYVVAVTCPDGLVLRLDVGTEC